MTEKKKFKKTVRARMKMTGERYTEALQAMKGLDEEGFEGALKRFLECQTVAQVEHEARIFHRKHFGNTPGWERLAAHVLEVVLPKRVSWATGKETPDPNARAITAPSDLRELLTQYQAGGVLPGMGNRVPTLRALKGKSGWLGTVPKEELLELYEGAEPDDEFEFDSEGSPPRYHILTPEEERVFEGIWMEAPNVDGAFGIFHQPLPRANHMYEAQRRTQDPLAETVTAIMPAEGPKNSQKKVVLQKAVSDLKNKDFRIGETVSWVAPVSTSLLSDMRAIIEQEGQRIVAFVGSSRDFADVRKFSPNDFGVKWEGSDGNEEFFYFGTPFWHTHELEAGYVVAMSDDDRFVVAIVTR